MPWVQTAFEFQSHTQHLSESVIILQPEVDSVTPGQSQAENKYPDESDILDNDVKQLTIMIIIDFTFNISNSKM